MAEETIVFTPGRELPPDILEQAWRMKPEGFNLQMMPGNASAADIAAAMRDAEYLVGFIRPLPDEAYTDAKQLKLVQVLSAGYDRINIEGARKARVPICQNGGANSVAVAEHTIMLILAVYRKLVAFHHIGIAVQDPEGREGPCTFIHLTHCHVPFGVLPLLRGEPDS